MSVFIDTLEASKKLTKAHFTKEQAEALVGVLSGASDRLVTREYLRGELASMEHRLTVKICGILIGFISLIVLIKDLL